MIVYLVTHGDYSAYEIVNVFLDKQKAENFVEHCNQNPKHNFCFDSDYRVEEYSISDDDFSLKDKPKTYFACQIYIKQIGMFQKGFIKMFGKIVKLGHEKVIINKRPDSIVVYSKQSMEHAKKVAIEQYQIYTQNELESEV